jgi:hypothetical protein
MKFVLLVLLVNLGFGDRASAVDSVVLGHGISNRFLSTPPCPQDADANYVTVCMDGDFMWVLHAERTVVGPHISGTVKAIASQHTEVRSEFVRSVELFVLRPIEDRQLRKSSGARYYIMALSPKDSKGCYCLQVQLEEVGLRLDKADIIAGDGGAACFKAELLNKGGPNLHWSGHAAKSSLNVGGDR